MTIERIPAWANGYVGVPFKDLGRDPQGWDCWGLLWWCFKTHFAIRLPSYAGDYQEAEAAAEVAGLMAGGMGPWRKLGERERPRLGDGALLRFGRHPAHVGLVVDCRRMLHVERRIRTQFEDFDGIMWQRRLAGIYRHRDMEAACKAA